MASSKEHHAALREQRRLLHGLAQSLTASNASKSHLEAAVTGVLQHTYAEINPLRVQEDSCELTKVLAAHSQHAKVQAYRELVARCGTLACNLNMQVALAFGP